MDLLICFGNLIFDKAGLASIRLPAPSSGGERVQDRGLIMDLLICFGNLIFDKAGLASIRLPALPPEEKGFKSGV